MDEGRAPRAWPQAPRPGSVFAGWSGDPDRHSLAVLTVPIALLLLALYVVATPHSLRRHRREHQEAETHAACTRK